jgi:hypothetical protein
MTLFGFALNRRIALTLPPGANVPPGTATATRDRD